MSTPVGAKRSKALRPNLVLTAKRSERGWGRTRAAREMRRVGLANDIRHLPDVEAMIKAIRRHETGESTPDELYSRLYCLTYRSSPHELFGEIDPGTERRAGARFQGRSHKFIPAYIGSDEVRRLRTRLAMEPSTGQWLEGHDAPFNHPDGACRLHTWPFGVAMFHVAEELRLPNAASLAVWRRSSYEANLAWAADRLQEMLGQPDTRAPYVLSAYWLESASGPAGELPTALRLMCMPRVLLERDDEWDGSSGLAHAELVERALLRDGFDHPEMVEFGIKGIAMAYASWSGVVYHPVAPERALPESELVACELAAQAIWEYCHHIRDCVEQGDDPDVDSAYGWRFLRAIRSRLVNPRPQETGHHRSMREAVLATSGLTEHLAEAMEILRESSIG